MQKKVGVEIFGLARDDSARAGGRHKAKAMLWCCGAVVLVLFPAPENWFGRRQHLNRLLCLHQESRRLVRKYPLELTKKLNCSMRH